MNSRDHIQDELQGLNSSLPSAGNGTPFTVPDGYFEGLAASVLARIKADQVSAAEEIARLSPLLAGISRTMPFQIPDHYFQTNIEVLPAITSEDEESLVLSFVDKEMPFEVPRGYFANLPEQVVDKVEEKASKVVAMPRRNWMRMAVAAMVAGIIAVSGFMYFNSGKRAGNSDVAGPIAAQHIVKELKNVSTEELDAFIKTTAVTVHSTETAKNTKTKDVKSLLKDVSDKELDAFLDQVPTDDTDEEVVL
jgi:hypothetical protein